jgi:hypothetical protein
MNSQIPQEPQTGPAGSSQPSTQKKDRTTDPEGGVKESLREAGEKIIGQTKRVATQAKEQGERYFDQGKAHAADCVGRISESLRATADCFEEGEDPNIAHYTRVVAGKLEGAAAYVLDRDFQHMRQDADDFARRHPVLFYGGMFTLGLAAARFLKATTHRGGDGPEEQPTVESPAPIGGG